MKSEQEVKQRYKEVEERIIEGFREGRVQARYVAELQTLKWMLEESEEPQITSNSTSLTSDKSEGT